MKITYVQCDDGKKLFVFHEGENNSHKIGNRIVYLTLINGNYIVDLVGKHFSKFKETEISDIIEDIRYNFILEQKHPFLKAFDLKYVLNFAPDDVVQKKYFEYCHLNQPINAEIMIRELEYRNINKLNK